MNWIELNETGLRYSGAMRLHLIAAADAGR
jgi:hypothetical protein